MGAAGYADPGFVRLCDQLRVAGDPGEEDRLYREITRVFQEDVPATFLYPTVWTTVASNRIRGLEHCAYRGDLTRCMDSVSIEGVI